jgi:hypothetical protein
MVLRYKQAIHPDAGEETFNRLTTWGSVMAAMATLSVYQLVEAGRAD